MDSAAFWRTFFFLQVLFKKCFQFSGCFRLILAVDFHDFDQRYCF